MRLSHLVTSTATMALLAIPVQAAAADCEAPSSTGGHAPAPAKATGGSLSAVRQAAAPFRLDVSHGPRRLTALAKADGALELSPEATTLRPGCLATPVPTPALPVEPAPSAPEGPLEVEVGGVVITADLDDVEVGGVVQVAPGDTASPTPVANPVLEPAPAPESPSSSDLPADPVAEAPSPPAPAAPPPAALPRAPADTSDTGEPVGRPAEAPVTDGGSPVVGVQAPGLDETRPPEDGPLVEPPEADDEPEPDEPRPEPTVDVALDIVQPDPAPVEDEDSADFDHYVAGLLAWLPDSDDEPDEVDPDDPTNGQSEDEDERRDPASGSEEPAAVFITVGDDTVSEAPSGAAVPDDAEPAPRFLVVEGDEPEAAGPASSAGARTPATPEARTAPAPADEEPEPLILTIGEDDQETSSPKPRRRLPSLGTEVARRAMFGPVSFGGSRDQFGPGDVSFA